LIRELKLNLVKAVDTHRHADHITGLGALRDRTHRTTMMGEQEPPSMWFPCVRRDGDQLEIEGWCWM
jgi:sulfur dioxygenase